MSMIPVDPSCKYGPQFSHISLSDIDYLRKTLPSNVEEEFFDYLKNLTPKDIKIHALQEGSIAFPRIPLIRCDHELISLFV